jgi:hypothetical protein
MEEPMRRAGDLTFPIKMRSYWKPVEAPAVEQEPEASLHEPSVEDDEPAPILEDAV